MLTNPFEKFERKRFMYYSKDLGQISLNHALLARLTWGILQTLATPKGERKWELDKLERSRAPASALL